MAGAYTLFGWARLAWEIALTRLFQPGARLIRRPLYIRGMRHIKFGRRITIGRSARIEAYGRGDEINIQFGDDVQLNDYVQIGSVQHVQIGDRVLIASRVFITDHNHGEYGERSFRLQPAQPPAGRLNPDGSMPGHSDPLVPPVNRPLASAPVMIGDDVWIGQGVCVLPGVTIGAGSIIGANAVVVHDIPPACIAVGAPARVVRRYEPTRGWVSSRTSAPTARSDV